MDKADVINKLDAFLMSSNDLEFTSQMISWGLHWNTSQYLDHMISVIKSAGRNILRLMVYVRRWQITVRFYQIAFVLS